MKGLLLLTLMLFGSVQTMFAQEQHLSFLGLELGGNPELLNYNLKEKGFKEVAQDNSTFLEGYFLKTKCKVFINDNNGIVDYILIDYRYNEDFSNSKADTIAKGIAQIISNELTKSNQSFFVAENVPLIGTIYGTQINVKNGWYAIMIDGPRDDMNHNWRVLIRLEDCPNNILYELRSRK